MSKIDCNNCKWYKRKKELCNHVEGICTIYVNSHWFYPKFEQRKPKEKVTHVDIAHSAKIYTEATENRNREYGLIHSAYLAGAAEQERIVKEIIANQMYINEKHIFYEDSLIKQLQVAKNLQETSYNAPDVIKLLTRYQKFLGYPIVKADIELWFEENKKQ